MKSSQGVRYPRGYGEARQPICLTKRAKRLDFLSLWEHCALAKPPKPMGALMVDDFIERQNITKFTDLLLQETDTAKRQLLQRLLTDEMVRQASLSKSKPIE